MLSYGTRLSVPVHMGPKQKRLKQLAGYFLFPSLVIALASNLFAGDSEYGLLIQVDAPEAEVSKAVQEVSEDQIIHGTYSYEKEKTLYGAHAAASSSAFREAPAPGTVFYKVAERVIAPKYFKDSGDIGTISLRYVVQSIEPAKSRLSIEAIFIDARHSKHASLGAVESAEYGAIKEHLQALQAKQRQQQAADTELARKHAQIETERQALKMAAEPDPTSPAANDSSIKELQAKVEDLRHRVERRIKSAATPLKSAPFKSAATVQSLPAQAEVIVLILTPYWYGVETEDGHRGWVHRNQVEPLP
ncbi:MAG TPA: SH3 domain-containing protein [Terriglobales bacterium]|nr:SH3 domain-containing protein [Terriglobales bacterium]